MTYSCVIVDDEPRICALIRKLGNWEEHHIEIKAVCYDGQSAVEAILKEKPDIVLTDMQIPVYTGTEIIEKVQAAGVYPHFVIISGYAEFEYAQKAMQLGAVDYLVKPINKEKLNAVLAKCVIRSGEEKALDEEKEDLRESRKDLFWRDLFKGEIAFAEGGLAPRYRIDWKDCDHVLWKAAAIINEEQRNSLVRGKAAELAAELFPDALIGQKEDDDSLWLIREKDEQEQDAARSLFAALKNLPGQQEGTRLLIARSRPFREAAALPGALEEAEKALASRYGHAGEAILSYQPEEGKPLGQYLDRSFLNAFRYELSQLNEDGCEGLLQRLQQDFLGAAPVSEGLEESGERLIGLSAEALALPQEERLQRYRQHSRSTMDYPAFFRLLQEEVKRQIKEKRDSDYRRLSEPVYRIREYIQAHYQEELSLSELAELADLSPAYFSAVFKKENGSGIAEYINEVRCHEAQRLLLESRLTTAAIAQEVGYNDEKYFLRQFKKTVGITPSQYRKVNNYE